MTARAHAEEGVWFGAERETGPLTGRQEAKQGQQPPRHGPAPACNAALAPPPLYQGCAWTHRACATPPPPPGPPCPVLRRRACSVRSAASQGREMATGLVALGGCP